jgi:hypothetical protein
MRGDNTVPDDITRKLFPNYPDDDQIEDFYAAVGHAIAAWQLVESELCAVHHVATFPGIPGAMYAAFHAIQTFNMKLAMTDMAVRFVLYDQEELRTEWARLKQRLTKKNEKRNHLAHFMVYTYFEASSKNDNIKIKPQYFDTRFQKNVRGDPPEYRVTEIDEIADSFNRLRKKVSAFAQRLHAVTIKLLPKPL